MTNVTDEFTRDELAELFQYLDSLRESGVTNMFGAAPYLVEQYGLDRAMARKVVTAWMTTYSTKMQPSLRVDHLLADAQRRTA